MKKKSSFSMSQYAMALSIALCLLMADAQVILADELTLEEIVVTARRRVENLQEIPEAVTVLNSEQLETAGITNLRELTGLVPNVSMFTGELGFRAGVVQLVVRGITTPQNGEPPLSFVVDGVTVPEIDFINQDLFDIESVQVLRGPQGALYGRGALGGAVLITTKQPTNDISGFIKAGYEQGADYRVGGSVSGPIIQDKLFFRLSGSYHDRDGLINNRTLHDDVDFKESKRLKGSLKFLVSDEIQLDWNFNYLDSELGGGAYGVVPNASLNSNFEDQVSANILGVNVRDIFETSVKLEWDFGPVTLTSVSAYAEIDDDIFSDGDFTENVAWAQRNANFIDSFTQEIRLTSADDQRLRWNIGAFYQDRSKEFEFDFADDVGRTNGSFPQRFDVTFEQRDHTDSTAVGVFTQFSYDITEQLELTGALRYDYDSRDFEDPRNSITRTSTSTDEFQPKVSLSYDWSKDLLVYLLYSHGYRSGGFNEIGFLTGVFDGPPGTYPAQSSDSIEGGFKATLLDGRMTLNLAAFHTELENGQYQSFDINTFTIGVLTIDEAEVTGLDLEVSANLFDGLDLSFGLGVSDTKVTDFDGTGLNDGNRIPYVPEYTVNVSAQYTWAYRDGWDVISRLDYNRTGNLSFDNTNLLNADTSDNVNLRLGLKTASWSLAAYAKNVTDNRTPAEAFDFSATEAARGVNFPRAFGVEVRYDY